MILGEMLVLSFIYCNVDVRRFRVVRYLIIIYFSLLFSNYSTYSLFQHFAVFCMLCAFFWVITRRLEFKCRRFGTICLFHLHIYLPMKMEQIECSEKSAYKLQTPGNYPKESTQHTEHGERLKSRIHIVNE